MEHAQICSLMEAIGYNSSLKALQVNMDLECSTQVQLTALCDDFLMR